MQAIHPVAKVAASMQQIHRKGGGSSPNNTAMPLFYLADRSANTTLRTDVREFADLGAALAEANRAARAKIIGGGRKMPRDLRGSLDVEDERQRPVARVLFADVARQIS